MAEGIFDTHAHYDDKRFDSDRDEVISSLEENGICGVINVGCDLETSKESLSLARKYPSFYSSVGIHPHYAIIEETAPDYKTRLKKIAVNNPKNVIAVGEIGLDYYYDNSPKELQKQVFEKMLSLAEELNLPVIIHSRDATEDTLSILKRHNGLKGVIHCYSYSAETARILLDMGFFIGFTGMITFDKSKKAAEAVKVIPKERLLLETDCPYMAPVPFRGKRCDSSMLPFTADKIAEIKELSTQELVDITRENAHILFNIK